MIPGTVSVVLRCLHVSKSSAAFFAPLFAFCKLKTRTKPKLDRTNRKSSSSNTMVKFALPSSGLTDSDESKPLQKTPYPSKDLREKHAALSVDSSFADNLAMKYPVGTPNLHEGILMNEEMKNGGNVVEKSSGVESKEYEMGVISTPTEANNHDETTDDCQAKLDVLDDEQDAKFKEDWNVLCEALLRSPESCEHRQSLEIMIKGIARQKAAQERVAKTYEFVENSLSQSLQRILEASGPLFHFLKDYMDVSAMRSNTLYC